MAEMRLILPLAISLQPLRLETFLSRSFRWVWQRLKAAILSVSDRSLHTNSRPFTGPLFARCAITRRRDHVRGGHGAPRLFSHRGCPRSCGAIIHVGP